MDRSTQKSLSERVEAGASGVLKDPAVGPALTAEPAGAFQGGQQNRAGAPQGRNLLQLRAVLPKD